MRITGAVIEHRVTYISWVEILLITFLLKPTSTNISMKVLFYVCLHKPKLPSFGEKILWNNAVFHLLPTGREIVFFLSNEFHYTCRLGINVIVSHDSGETRQSLFQQHDKNDGSFQKCPGSKFTAKEPQIMLTPCWLSSC